MTEEEMKKEIEIYNSLVKPKDKYVKEMTQMVEITGSDVIKKFKQICKDYKKKKKQQRREIRRKEIKYFLYKLTHFGKEHPDVFQKNYYTEEMLSSLYDGLKNQKNRTCNLNRKMFLTGNGSWLVGPKIYEEN